MTQQIQQYSKFLWQRGCHLQFLNCVYKRITVQTPAVPEQTVPSSAEKYSLKSISWFDTGPWQHLDAWPWGIKRPCSSLATREECVNEPIMKWKWHERLGSSTEFTSHLHEWSSNFYDVSFCIASSPSIHAKSLGAVPYSHWTKEGRIQAANDFAHTLAHLSHNQECSRKTGVKEILPMGGDVSNTFGCLFF